MKITLFAFLLLFNTALFSQQTTETMLPYHEIPESPETYNAGTVVSRMIDGLGFRYYWATEGLTEKDLTYKPTQDSRSSLETIEHIYNLSEVIVNTALEKINDFTVEKETLSYKDMRKRTLINFKKASDIIRELEDFKNNKVVFKTQRGTREYPFWNNINGPISDAIWHCGQVVSFRRTSGNPFNSKASVLTGKIRN